MKFILGQKVGMTQKFASDGRVVPCTIIDVSPSTVTQVRTMDKHGYKAVQLGFGKKKNVSKPLAGQLSKLLGQPASFKWIKEFRVEEDLDLKPGSMISVKTFKSGDMVKVSGISKGQGFQGVVKRHGFHGHPATHGHKDQLRMPGSIGSTGPQRVFKGVRMAGRMGGETVTVTNLDVYEIDAENNLLFLHGAVPGPKGGLLLISGEGDLIMPVEEVVEEKTEAVEPVAEVVADEQPVEAAAVQKESTEEVKPVTEQENS